MPAFFTKTPTIYNDKPHAFFVRNFDNATLKTSGTQVLDLFEVRKGTAVISCWVDVVTAAGAAGNITLQANPTGGSVTTLFSTPDAAVAGMYTGGPDAAIGSDPFTHDGFMRARKTGTGTALVVSIYVLMVRPRMSS